MLEFLILARLVLAATFGLAAITKLWDPLETRRSVIAFGFPERWGGPLAGFLPVVELGVTGMLIAPGWAAGGALASLILLLTFSGLQIVRLWRGQQAACGCFGALDREPTGVSGLMRNLLCIVLASSIVGLGWNNAGPNLVVWLSSFGISGWVALALGVAACAMIPAALQRLPPNVPQPRRVEAAAQAGPRLTSLRKITRIAGKPTLTIGMATYRDYDGVYFTLQALRLYQDVEEAEIIVVDNWGCADTRSLVENWVKGRYILAPDSSGTAAPRQRIFDEARGEAVLVLDCHVLLWPGAIARLRDYYARHPESRDLIQGPLVYDDGRQLATHFEPVWREAMYGVWGSDRRGEGLNAAAFEIGMQGLGVFSCRREAWPGFNPQFRGFGGEEGYLHEKFRQAGGRCLCLPGLRWMHRFGRPNGVPYPVDLEDRVWNYAIGAIELGLDLKPMVEHFSSLMPRQQVLDLIAGAAMKSNLISVDPAYGPASTELSRSEVQ